jgi:hypothetical protein
MNVDPRAKHAGSSAGFAVRRDRHRPLWTIAFGFLLLLGAVALSGYEHLAGSDAEALLSVILGAPVALAGLWVVGVGFRNLRRPIGLLLTADGLILPPSRRDENLFVPWSDIAGFRRDELMEGRGTWVIWVVLKPHAAHPATGEDPLRGGVSVGSQPAWRRFPGHLTIDPAGLEIGEGELLAMLRRHHAQFLGAS